MSQTINISFNTALQVITLVPGSPTAPQDILITFSDRGVAGPAGPTGPQGPAGSSGSIAFTSANKDSITVVKGTPVTEDVSGSGFVRADATANGKFCVGFANADIVQNVSGPIMNGGTIALADWTAIAGTATLAIKGVYYLDVVAGKIATTAPSTPGQRVQRIGFAVDSLTLSINIGYPILL